MNVCLYSERLLVRIQPRHVAMFRFLLEANENLAYFTVLDKKEALLKVIFAPQGRSAVIDALERIKISIPLQWEEWLFKSRQAAQ